MNNEKDLTIIAVEQKLGLISTPAARGYLPNNGRLIARLTKDEVRNLLLGFRFARN
jgi:hypothetical protein